MDDDFLWNQYFENEEKDDSYDYNEELNKEQYYNEKYKTN